LDDFFASLKKIRAFNDDLESDLLIFLLRQSSYHDETEASPWIVLSFNS